MIVVNIITCFLSWMWGVFHEVFTLEFLICLILWIWDVFQKTITVNVIVWVLPWLWMLFKAIFFGEYWYITCFVPYALLVEYYREITNKRKKTIASAMIHESNVISEIEVCTDANYEDCTVNNDDEQKSEVSDEILYEIKTPWHWYSAGNPFLATIDTTALVTAGEGSPLLIPTNPFFEECISNDFMFAAGDGCPPLLSTNPFLQDCITNPFIDTCVYFPNIFDDPLVDMLFYPSESEIYCAQWIEQHLKYFSKTGQQF